MVMLSITFMNTITITVTHPEAEQAKFTFGDRLALL